MTPLADEIILSVLAFADRPGIAAAASVSHRWNEALNSEGAGNLWAALVERHHPAIIGAAEPGRAPAGGWRDFFLRTERLIPLTHDLLSREVSAAAERIRNGPELFGNTDGRWITSRPFASPTAGTTATETPDSFTGAFSTPVYYDWGANWERVKALVPTEPVQNALNRSVNDARPFDRWDREKVWPFLYRFDSRNGNGQEDALMRELLPRGFVLQMNDQVAARFLARGRSLISGDKDDFAGDDNYTPTELVEDWMVEELYSGERLEDEEAADLVDQRLGEMTEDLYVMMNTEPWGRDLHEETKKKLYDEDGPMRETLLCALHNSYAFMPFNYILAKLLFPEDAQLRVYASAEYSVVIDETRNVLFDNFWHFVGKSPVDTLACSRDRPQLLPTEFDFTLGGLVN